MRSLEVIFKVAERCNINCDYCYYFNGADRTFRTRPRMTSDETVHALVRYLRDAIAELGIARVQIDFHGGEPLLVGTARFARWAEILSSELGGAAKLDLCVQTNSTLVDGEWIEVFAAHDIRVSTSIDGIAAVHDAHRVDKRGRGTYEATRRGARLLLDAAAAGRIAPPGVLAVIDPRITDGAAAYDHLVHDLGFRLVDFLLPDVTHDGDVEDVSAYADYLIAVFDRWTADDDTSVVVRLLSSMLRLLLGGHTELQGVGRAQTLAVTVTADGMIQPDDTLRSCGPDMMQTGLTVFDSSLRDVLAGERMQEITAAKERPASACESCVWLNVCGGGHLVNRFGTAARFDNPSVYCGALERVVRHIAAFTVRKGMPPALLAENLGLSR